MSAATRAVRIILSLAVLLWAAVLVSGAIAAMNVFGYTDHEALTMERYAAYPVQAHPRLLAGGIMEGVFFIADLIQFVVVPTALLCLLIEHVAFRARLRKAAPLIRAICLVAAAAIFAWHGLVAAPHLNRELREYWTAAELGDIETAQVHHDAFNAGHRPAEWRLQAMLWLVLIAAGAGAVTPLPAPTPRAPRGGRERT